MKELLYKLRESVFSIIPVAAIVVILNFTPLIDLGAREIIIFIICSAASVIGIALFNYGADLAMMPMGDHIGAGLSKSRSPRLMLAVCFLMGLFITIAEPDLSVLAAQVSSAINSAVLIGAVAVGVAIFIVLAVLKIMYRMPLSSLLTFFYLLLFGLLIFVLLRGNGNFVSVAFDSGGVTTGPITVPFIMALGLGIANTIGGKNRRENSFGLISMASVGPIIAVAALGIFVSGTINYKAPDYSMPEKILPSLLNALFEHTKDVAAALALILAFFLFLQMLFLKLPGGKLAQIGLGSLFTFTGLVIFLSSVSIGFMPIGYKIGVQLSSHKWFLVGFGVIIGTIVAGAEPAVRILTSQVESVTDGSVKKYPLLISLCVGVGGAIGLSLLRIVLDFNLLWVVVPGYLIAIIFSLFVPGIYTAIAFDSGGVASGPLTSGFILPMMIGACIALQGESAIMSDAFGVVAVVAMAPPIVIQLLGFRSVAARIIAKKKATKRILSADDGRIINFDR